MNLGGNESSKAFHEHPVMVFLEVTFEVLQFFIQFWLGLGNSSLVFRVDMGFVKVHLFLFHEFSNDHEGAPGHV
jgi:hypothetical protein